MKIAIFFLFYGSFALANINTKSHCSKELSKHLNTDHSQNKFLKVFDPQKKILRSPTNKIGTWVQFSSDHKRFNEYWKFTPLKTVKYQISKNCEFDEIDTSIKNNSISYNIPKFTDSDLEIYLSKNKNGLIYLFNPSFVYSIKFLKNAEQFAKSKKINFMPLAVSRSGNNKSLKRSIASTGLPLSLFKINTSNELKMMQAELHAPTFVFYKNGKLIYEKLVGVYTDKSLQKNYQKVFK